LPVWEQQRIKLINKVSESVVSVVWLAPSYKYVYEYIDLGDGIMLKVPQGVVKQGYKVVSAWTAFFITSNGILLTNNHVVQDPNLIYKIVTSDGKVYKAKVLIRSKKYDLALLYVKWKNFKPLKLWNSDWVMLGQSVYAIWNALWEYSNTVSAGIISGLHRQVVVGDEIIEEAIQTDAAINPWNSGGPLIDSLGYVIGINTAINAQGQNIGFAIPINTFKKWIKSLLWK
jgi:serine protease Do